MIDMMKVVHVTFHDQKGYARAKAAKAKAKAGGTGGGPKCDQEVSQIEARILDSFGWVAATGDTSVPEFGVPAENLVTSDLPGNEIIVEDFVFTSDSTNSIPGGSFASEPTAGPSGSQTSRPVVPQFPKKKKRTTLSDRTEVAVNEMKAQGHLLQRTAVTLDNISEILQTISNTMISAVDYLINKKD